MPDTHPDTGKFRKKPVEIQAIQFTGSNYDDVAAFMGGHPETGSEDDGTRWIALTTIHGDMAYGRPGDWIIPESMPGRFYPCKPDIFEATYERVDAARSEEESTNGGVTEWGYRVPWGDVTPCVFCAIVDGHTPAIIIREWPDVIAIRPRDGGVTYGHVLVIPRTHVADAGADPAVAALTMTCAAELMATHPDANIITSRGSAATQTVFHLHIHVVPRRHGDGLALPWTPSGPAETEREAR